MAVARYAADHRSNIYKLFAYIGRYAHQSIGEMRHMTLRELTELSAQVNELLSEENDSFTSRLETDG